MREISRAENRFKAPSLLAFLGMAAQVFGVIRRALGGWHLPLVQANSRMAGKRFHLAGAAR